MPRGGVVIIGAGLAGAATAYWLRRFGAGEVLVLEREDLPGSHASGRNAGIARQALLDGPTTLLAARGTAFLRNPPPGFAEAPLFRPTGGYLLGSEEEDRRLALLRRHALAAGVYTYPADRGEVVERIPYLDGAPFPSTLACPLDGLVDIHLLLSSYLKGIPLRTGVEVTGFEAKGDRITAVRAGDEVIPASAVVNAAGPWACAVAALAGARPLELQPRRRHLIHTGTLPGLPPDMPYAWFLDPEVYFRPESGGLLLSPCDETPHPAQAPAVHPEAPLWLASKLKAAAPRMGDLPVGRFWAGLRTFSDDGRFVLGRDGEVENFFWVAGLGGHGMTTSAAVGEMAAALVLGRTPPLDPSPYDPSRFG